MSKPSIDGRHRTKDGEITGKHGSTLSGRFVKCTGKDLQPVATPPRFVSNSRI